MKLSATVRDRDGDKMEIARDNYSSKKEFKETLNQNGFTVIGRIYAEGDELTHKGGLYWNHGVR